jgi:hypothetical protein
MLVRETGHTEPRIDKRITSMTQQATPESASSSQPINNKQHGVATEFTLVVPLQPGGAERIRELMKMVDPASIGDLGTIHEARAGIFDNDTKLLFASTFDGSWDNYIDDFAAKSKAKILLDRVLGESGDYPGLESPEVKDWIAKHQIDVVLYSLDSPEATAKRVKKSMRVLNAFDEILDAAG